MESTSIVAIPGSRLPEMLGNFQLDNHHVEEWSDPAAEPGHKHRARKEVGKWVNLEKSADIHYQKQEDSKHSDRSQERSRTEVIQGTAPDSSFQVVRSHRQYQDGDDRSGSKLQQTSSTSYHVSSSRGVRSTTKTTSNKTTTKTVSVSGGGRADDFENLRMSFTPLDTSTQRERITVSRSGTMGIRRPPTRRHTPAALLCSSPEDGPEAQRPDEGQILVDSDDNLRDTPDPDVGKMNEQAAMSIIGFKNISPKIRVGFPVEIQLELQNKLRSSSTLERDNHHHHPIELEYNNHAVSNTKETDSNNATQTMLPIPLGVGISSAVNISSRDSSFDLKQTKMSSTTLFTDHTTSLPKESPNNGLFTNGLRSSMHELNSRKRDSEDYDRSENRMSWDLLQNMRQSMNEQGSIKSKLYSTLSSGTSSGEDYAPTHRYGTIIDDDDDDDDVEYDYEKRRNSFTQRLRTINNVNSSSSDTKTSLTTLNATSREPLNFGSLEIGENDTYNYDQDSKLVSTPDVLHHDNSNNNSLSPSLERSRKLLKMLDETPDLINKMSFKSYFSAATEKEESKDWGVDDAEKDDQMDWETQRQLSFLNDSLSRILDETRSIESINVKGLDIGNIKSSSYQNGHGSSRDLLTDLDLNENFNEMSSKTVQVSQTWISSVDQKPAQTVRDNDVVTSISATNDAYKKTGPKKVEFCKTEVHFTPESGRFNIVETDENKPSTAHLFRKKKRSERKSQRSSETQQSSSFSSSSSSMSSLESTSTTTETRTSVVGGVDTAYIVEMDVSNGDKQNEPQKPDHLQFSKETNTSTVQIEDVSSPTEPNAPPLLVPNGSPINKSGETEKSVDDRSSRVFINLDSITNSNHDEFEDDIRSPSHMILSNYGEMKIQRYLKQLKTPSSREGSSSPLGSPTATHDDQHHRDNQNNDEDGHFRFDNILYENGSFVPLATRRSLIEMNNRNRKRLNAATSQSSDNSSTTSTYSLPTSDKDQYGTLRLGSMETVIATNGSRPQTTSVDFRYKHDNDDNDDDDDDDDNKSGGDESPGEEKLDNMGSDIEYHNLSVRERRERFSSVPSPVLPYMYGVKMRHSSVISPTDSQTSEITNSRPLSSTYISKKPPTPILPFQFASFEKTGAELRERFLSKTTNNNNNNMTSSTISETNEASSNTTYPSSRKSEAKTKSVVTIGSTSNELVDHESKSREMTVTTTTIDESTEQEADTVLSLDHTWKGPSHYENDHHQETYTQNIKDALNGSVRSLTIPKSLRAEPEWVSKAKSRETRVTDWSLIEKQQTTTTSRNTEPPWISEIRFRNKPTPNEELKSLPKISVVYPWQRENSSSKESSVERQDSEESHIVSIIPEPPFNGNITVHKDRNDKRFGSQDLYSGKSLPPIKSLKSVPEVSLPISRNKNKSVVEVHSEPEHYISSPLKHNYSMHSKSNSNIMIMDGYAEASTITKTNKSSSSSSKKSSSMRVTTDAGNVAVSLNESRREVETFPKKSRKPLQVTQQHKERSPRAESAKQEEKHKTQPKPPKPPQRGTSLHREEACHSHTHGDITLLTAPSYREATLARAHNERSSDTSVLTSHTNTSTKKSTTRRSKGVEMATPVMLSPPPQHPHQRESSHLHQPVIHRHPTIQITKMPMRTAKVSVVDGKRVTSGNSSSNKSKAKHHATTSAARGENSKPSSSATTKNYSGGKCSGPSGGRDQKRAQTTTTTKTQEISIQNSAIRGKPRRTCHQTPLKTSTRSPSLDLETKKRKTNVGGELDTKGDNKRK